MAMPINSCYMPPGLRMPMGTVTAGFPQAAPAGLAGLSSGMPGMGGGPIGSQQPLQQHPLPSMSSSAPAQASFPSSFQHQAMSTPDGTHAGTPCTGSAHSSKDGKGASQPTADFPGPHLQQAPQPQQQQFSLQSAPHLGGELPGYPLGSQLGMSLHMSNPSSSQQQQQQQQMQLQQHLLQMGSQGDLSLQQQQQQQWQQQIPTLHVAPGVKLEAADNSGIHQPQPHDSSQGLGPAQGSALNASLPQWSLPSNGLPMTPGDPAQQLQPQQQQQQQMSLLQFHQQQMQLQWMQDAQRGLNPSLGEDSKQNLQQLLPQQLQQQQQQLTPASLAQLQVGLRTPSPSSCSPCSSDDVLCPLSGDLLFDLQYCDLGPRIADSPCRFTAP